MTVSAVSSSMNIGLTHTDGLTPDGMVLYLQTQLEDIDTKVESFMAKQTNIRDQRKELNTLSRLLDTLEVKDDDSTVKLDKALREDWSEAYEKLLDLGFDPGNLNLKTANKDALSQEDLQSLKTGVNGAINDLDSGSELNMIQLQSCISQRNTAISLATNLLSALGKGQESIAGNIGR